MDIIDIKKKIMELSVNDFISLIKLAKKINIAYRNVSEKNTKIAVIGSGSQQHFVAILRLLLLKYDVIADILEGEYDGINQAVFDSQSKFYAFHPEVVIILNSYRDIRDMPSLFSEKQEIEHFVDITGNYYQNIWNKISKVQNCHIFQSNIVTPLERELGNLEANVYYSKRNIYNLLNIELMKKRLPNVSIIDMDYIASAVGKESWFDSKLYFTAKVDYSLKHIGMVCDVYAQQIAVLYGKMRKCLVLDLDNTLWGGIVADDGVEGIHIGLNDAIGEAYSFFQQYVLKLKDRGVILAVISKNDYEVAKEPFIKNENMILKYQDFSAFIANWDSKALNIELVAKKLHIGMDSLVFFDDNPAEREIVKMYHPEVLVVDVPDDPSEYVLTLERIHPFEGINLTQEDLQRTDSYISNEKRELLASRYTNYQEYLAALEMTGKVCYLKEEKIERFTQLINKTNQFNVRTQRYSEADIKRMLSNNEYKLLYVSLEDRFTKFGIISCVILHKRKKDCFIDTWVMSCRVLNREVEFFTFIKIIEAAEKWKCESIVGEYLPTKKNEFVKDLFCKLGFQFLKEEKQQYKYDISVEFMKNTEIKEGIEK